MDRFNLPGLCADAYKLLAYDDDYTVEELRANIGGARSLLELGTALHITINTVNALNTESGGVKMFETNQKLMDQTRIWKASRELLSQNASLSVDMSKLLFDAVHLLKMFDIEVKHPAQLATEETTKWIWKKKVMSFRTCQSHIVEFVEKEMDTDEMVRLMAEIFGVECFESQDGTHFDIEPIADQYGGAFGEFEKKE